MLADSFLGISNLNLIIFYQQSFLLMDRTPKNNDDLTSPLQHFQNALSPQTDQESETSSPNQFRNGLVTFKAGISKKNAKTILKNKRQNIFRMQKWSFQSSKLSSEKENQFYSHIDQLAISQLEYTQTKVNTILKIILHIDLKNLTKLSLPGNSIANIEALGLLNAQNLKFIDLSGNNICQSKSLAKLNLSNLQYLDACNNPLFELNLGRIKQQNPKVYYRLMTFPSQIVFQQIGFVAKLEQNVVSCIMEFDLKYYSGQSRFGYNFDGYKDEKKVILHKKVCQTLKKKLMFSWGSSI